MPSDRKTVPAANAGRLKSRVASPLWRLFADRGGNFAIVSAVCIVPLVLGVGLAVEYSRATRESAEIQNSADAAMLAGAKEIQDQLADGKTQAAALAAGKALAIRFFKEQYGSPDGFKPVYVVESGGLKGEGHYSGTMPNAFAAFFTTKEVKLDIVSKVALGNPGFIDIHLVIDNSASMGVGATDDDVSIMAKAIKCAFACHAPPGHIEYTTTTDKARSAGATLRIDVVKAAVAGFVDKLQAAGFDSKVRLAVHSFSNTLSNDVAPTYDYAKVKTSINALELNGDWLQGGTSFDYVLGQLASNVGSSGTGADPAKPRKVVVFITDGVATNVMYNQKGDWEQVSTDPNYVFYEPVYNGRYQWSIQGFNPKACWKLTNLNKVDLFTLNIEYLIPKKGTYDNRYNLIEDNLKDKIDTNLAACASTPDKHFHIQDNQGIIDSLDSVLGAMGGKTLQITG